MIDFMMVAAPIVLTHGLGVRTLATVTVDATDPPATVVEKNVNGEGNVYYSVSFVVAIHFLTTLEFKVIVDGKVVASTVADYL
jgi:hypothetical protein